MAFIISKLSKSNGETRKLYYLVKSYRENDKIKRKKLFALKTYSTLAKYLEASVNEESKALSSFKRLKGESELFIKTGKTSFLPSLPPEQDKQRLITRIENTKSLLQEVQGI